MAWALRCSFCKKSAAEVSKLVAGPGVRICDECVGVASRLMVAPPPPRATREQRSLRHRIAGGIRRWFSVVDSFRVSSRAWPS
jgi:ClpX C4-type zinc finger protein